MTQRGPQRTGGGGLSSRHPLGGSQVLVTPIPGDLTPPFGHHGHCSYLLHTTLHPNLFRTLTSPPHTHTHKEPFINITLSESLMSLHYFRHKGASFRHQSSCPSDRGRPSRELEPTGPTHFMWISSSSSSFRRSVLTPSKVSPWPSPIARPPARPSPVYHLELKTWAHLGTLKEKALPGAVA